MRRVMALGAAMAMASWVAFAAEGPLAVSFDGSLTPLANATVQGELRYTEGVRGKALLTGGATRLIVPADAFYPLANGTFMLWVKPMDWTPSDEKFHFFAALQKTDAAQPVRMILYKPYNVENVVLLIENAPQGQSVHLQRPAVTWRKGQWHHLAFTWERGGQVRFYVDGRLAGQQAAFDLPGGNWQLLLGIPWPGWAYLGDGLTALDELTILDHALPESEIAAVHARYAAAANVPAPTGRINLATERNGAYVLASSFRNTDTFYPDALIDGDDETLWRAWDNTWPQWIEMRWPHPVRVEEVVLRPLPPTRVASGAVETWTGAEWKTLAPLAVGAGAQDAVACKLPLTTTDRLRVVLTGGEGSLIQFSAIEAFGPPQPLLSNLEPYWKSWYIWYPEPDRRHKASAPRYFRKTFTLDDPAALQSAHAQARSNDYYRLYVNGREVASGSTQIWPIPVKDYLQAGRNTLAVMADLGKDPGQFGWGELIVELALNYPDRTDRIGTDASWKTFDALVTGWEKGDFDDAAWKPVALYTQPPDGPWGKIPYFPTAVGERVTLNRVVVTPEISRPDSDVQIALTLTPAEAIRNDYVFFIELRGREGMKAYCDFRLASALVTPDPATVGWTAEKPVTLTASLRLPRWSPDGPIPLLVRALDTKRGVALDLRDTEGKPVQQAGVAAIRRFDAPAPAAERPQSSVIIHNNSPVFQIGDAILPPLTWNIFTTSYERAELYYRSGVKITFLDANVAVDEDPKTRQRVQDHYDAQIRALLAVDPQAWFILTFELRPTQAWLKANPDERMITALGEPGGPVSFASEKYKRLIDEYMRSLVRFLNAQPYAGRIVGFRPMSFGSPDSVIGGCDVNTWQTDRAKVAIGDYNPQAIRAFQDYLRKEYDGSVAALRKAWKDATATFESARPVPAELTRAPEDGGVFIDPSLGVSAKKYDYCRFLATLIPDNYLRITRLLKEETQGRALVGTHYGYIVEHLRGIHPPGPQHSNDFGFDRLLRDPSLDFYCGAPHYSFRGAGNPFVNMFPHASIALHNRLYLSDSDYRTVIAGDKTYGRLPSMQETVAVLKRDMATECIRGFGCWHSDMSTGGGRSAVGWFAHPEITETIGRMNALYAEALQRPRRSAAEIAVFVSDHTWFYHDVFGAQNIYNNLIVRTLYQEMARLGAPFDVYMTQDLSAEQVQNQYKLYVFLNPYHLTEAEARGVESLKRGGKTLLWFYAPGYVDPAAGLSVESLSRTAGITVRKKPAPREFMEYTLSDAQHVITRGSDPKAKRAAVGFGYPQTEAMHPPAFGPVFYADDPQAVVLGKYNDGRAALVCKELPGWKAIYCAVPFADAEILGGAARWAGVHFYTEPGVVVEADNRLLMLHNGWDKPRTVTVSLPATTDVTDAWTGKPVASRADRFPVTLTPCDTQIFWLK